MNSRSLILIALILFSVLVLVFYVQPRIDELRAKEQSLAELRNTVSQTTELNNLLASHLAKVESIRSADLQKIEHFLPQEVDAVVVARDMSGVALDNGLAITGLMVGETSDATERNGQLEERAGSSLQYRVDTTALSFTFTGEYDSIKRYLEQLELNIYPIKITEMKISPRDTSTGQETSALTGYQLELTVELYSFNLI